MTAPFRFRTPSAESQPGQVVLSNVVTPDSLNVVRVVAQATGNDYGQLEVEPVKFELFSGSFRQELTGPWKTVHFDIAAAESAPRYANLGAENDNSVSLTGLAEGVLRSLKSEPFEEGIAHAGEAIIAEMVGRFALTGPEKLQKRFLSLFDNDPALASGLLKCIARVRSPFLDQALQAMILASFRHSDVRVREAGTFAIEVQERREMLWLIANQVKVETVEWLRSYMKHVERDLQYDDV